MAVNVYLHNHIREYFPASASLFDQIMALRGECYRHQKGRLTQRIVLGDKQYFIKQHKGVGWKEIFKNVLQGRWPVLSAKNEWCAIEKLKSVGIAVPVVVGYGERGVNPARLESFILMEELSPTTSLEEISKSWEQSPPTFAAKQRLISEVARIARLMHENGINHRDFYICHFLLGKPDNTIYLIDLHRAQIHKNIPIRWIIKDLAGLYFSSKDAGLTRRDLLRFVRAYRGKTVKEILQKENKFWQKIIKRGEELYRDHSG